MENVGTGRGLTASAVEFADAEERSRAAALRARIAILAAGGEPEEPPAPAPAVDVAAAVSATVRELLPGLLRDGVRETVRGEVQAAVSAALPGLLAPVVDEALRRQRDDVIDVVSRQVTELRASAVANATMPALGPDALLVEMVSLRSDVARSVGEIHQRIAEYVAERFAAVRSEIRADLAAEVSAGHGVVVDRIRRSLSGQVGAALAPIQEEFTATAQAHRAQVGNLSDEARTLVGEQVEVLRDAADEIEFLGESLRSTLTAYADEQLAVLEGAADRSAVVVADLSDAVAHQLEEFSARVAKELHEVVVAGRESLGAIGPSVRGDVQAVTGAVRSDVETLTGSVHTDLEQLAARVRRDVEGLTSRARDDLGRLVEDVRVTLASDLEVAVAAAREGAVAATGEAVERGVAELREAVAGTGEEIAANRSEVELFSDRFNRAGRALLDHLAARDLLLEQARDELVAVMLADLTAGMSERDRSAAGRRLTQIAQRRRDARDAERWRAGRPVAPAYPADVSDEQQLVSMLDATTPLAQTPPSDATPRPDAASGEPDPDDVGATERSGVEDAETVRSAPLIDPQGPSGDAARSDLESVTEFPAGPVPGTGDGPAKRPTPSGTRPRRTRRRTADAQTDARAGLQTDLQAGPDSDPGAGPPGGPG